MRPCAWLVLAACGAPLPPRPLSSDPATPARPPVLLYLEEDDLARISMHWVSADGARAGEVAAGALIGLRDPVVTPTGVWLEGMIEQEHASVRDLVLARRTQTGIELTPMPAPGRVRVAPDGTQAVFACGEDAWCLAPLSPSGLGARRSLRAVHASDTLIGWRGGELVVAHNPIRTVGAASGVPVTGPTVSYGDISRYDFEVVDPASGERRALGSLPGGDKILADPSGTAFAIPRLGYTRVTVGAPEHPSQVFDARTPEERGWGMDRWMLVTPTTLLCGERRGTAAPAQLVAFTASSHDVLAQHLVGGAAAIDGHAAFVDGNQLVATDLRGAHRVVLLPVPLGARIQPIAWLP